MKVLLQNFPNCPEFSEDSFTSVYHETDVWNAELYWKLDKEIYDLAEVYAGTEIPRDVAWPLVRIFSYLMMSIQAHFLAEDGFRITDVDDEFVCNWRERLQGVVEGFFSGYMPANSTFDLVNPLLPEEL